MSDTDCQKTIDALIDNMEPDTFAAEHLKVCKTCRDTRKSIEQLRISSSPVAAVLPSAAFMSKFKARLESQTIESVTPVPSPVSPGILLVVALAASIIVSVAYFAVHNNEPDVAVVSQVLPTIPAHINDATTDSTKSLIDIPDQSATEIFYPSPLQKPE